VIGLIDTADVYIQNASGVYATLAQAGLRCRLAHVNTQAASSGVERAELAALRNLIWDPGYVMPEAAQLVAGDGGRWNVQAGTLKALRGPSGTITYRQCDVVRAADG